VNALPLTQIRDEDVAAYARDGVVCLRRVFDQNWIDLLYAAIEDAAAMPGPNAEVYTPAGQPGRFWGDLDLWQRCRRFRRFVFESPAAPVAARVMRSRRVNFFYDQLLVKEPGTRERTPWHQDQPYWAVDGEQVCTVWLALDAVAAEHCVEYVAGSHHWNRCFNPHHFSDGSPYAGTGLDEMPDIDAERERHRILTWRLDPGDCLVFQAMIVHGAPGTAGAPHRRRALATRWTGDDARYCVRRGEVAIPTSDPGLRHGDPMDCPLFPRVWPRTNTT